MSWDDNRPIDKLRRMVADLDRCPHGRHKPDPCSFCDRITGANQGNIWHRVLRIGTNLDAKPIFLADLLNAVEEVVREEPTNA